MVPQLVGLPLEIALFGVHMTNVLPLPERIATLESQCSALHTRLA